MENINTRTHIVQNYKYLCTHKYVYIMLSLKSTAHTEISVYNIQGRTDYYSHNGVFMIAIDYNYILITGSLYSSQEVNSNNNNCEIQCCTDVND